MLRKLTKTFIAIFLLLLGGYLLFPWWAGWLISINLPPNVTLATFKSQYPGIKDIWIEELSLNIDDKTVTSVSKLIEDERINELAKMISGEEVTSAAKENAVHLLNDN